MIRESCPGPSTHLNICWNSMKDPLRDVRIEGLIQEYTALSSARPSLDLWAFTPATSQQPATATVSTSIAVSTTSTPVTNGQAAPVTTSSSNSLSRSLGATTAKYIGIIFGSLCGVAIICVIIWLYCTRHKRRKKPISQKDGKAKQKEVVKPLQRVPSSYYAPPLRNEDSINLASTLNLAGSSAAESSKTA